jgi:hypothetical protein
VPPPRERRCGGPVDDPHADRRGLEEHSEGVGVVGGIEERGRAVEHVDRLRRPLGPTQREREHHGRCDASRVVSCAFERRLEVQAPVRKTGACLGHTELKQQARLLL